MISIVRVPLRLFAPARVKSFETIFESIQWVSDLLHRFVDPRDGRKCRWCGNFADEPLGMQVVGVKQNGTAQLTNLLGPSVVDVSGRVIANTRMNVVLVVPGHEALTVGLGVLETAEPIRKVRPVLEGAKLAFRVGVDAPLTG